MWTGLPRTDTTTSAKPGAGCGTASGSTVDHRVISWLVADRIGWRLSTATP